MGLIGRSRGGGKKEESEAMRTITDPSKIPVFAACQCPMYSAFSFLCKFLAQL